MSNFSFWLLMALCCHSGLSHADIKDIIASAERGDVESQFDLGLMYANGLGGVPKDAVKAIKWLTKAAEQGDHLAQYHLGEMYAEGEGIPQDKTKAIEWLTKAAEHGLNLAQHRLGEMYLGGDGTSVNLIKAHAYTSIARANGINFANVDAISSKMTPEQIAEAKKLATEIFERIKAKK